MNAALKRLAHRIRAATPDRAQAIACHAAAGLHGHAPGCFNPVDPGSYTGAADGSDALVVEEWMAFRGLLFARIRVDPRAVAVAFLFTDTAVEHPADRVDFVVPIASGQADDVIGLGVRLGNGERLVIPNPGAVLYDRDPGHWLFQRFRTELAKMGTGKLLEIGSRARSGATYRHVLPDGFGYVGLDIKAGPNVDVVGDAHALGLEFEHGAFDAALSVAVFEHLMMPWKVAVELNKVLKPGGVAFISSHQTYPLHEQPWDFFRFSDSAWHSLFNAATGFEVIGTVMLEPAAVAGRTLTPLTNGMDSALAHLGSAVLCRKVATTTLDWPCEPDEIMSTAYPN